MRCVSGAPGIVTRYGRGWVCSRMPACLRRVGRVVPLVARSAWSTIEEAGVASALTSMATAPLRRAMSMSPAAG